MKKECKKIIFIIVFFLVFGLLAYGIFYLYTSGRPTPATAEQVQDSLSEYGLQPMDITNTSMDNFPGFGLESCIIAEQNDIRFDFYKFDNIQSAQKVFQQAYNEIIEYRTNDRVQFHERKLHYSVYILDNSTDYYLTMYAENTAVYARCSSENATKINAVLDSLGYIDASGEDWHSDSPFDSIVRVVVYALCIPVMYITRIWIWPVLYKSAGVTRREVLAMGDSRKEIIPKLIKRSSFPKLTKLFALVHKYISLPAYAALIFSVAGCFTDSLDGIIDFIGVVIPIIMVCVAFIFMIINRVMGDSWKQMK